MAVQGAHRGGTIDAACGLEGREIGIAELQGKLDPPVDGKPPDLRAVGALQVVGYRAHGGGEYRKACEPVRRPGRRGRLTPLGRAARKWLPPCARAPMPPLPTNFGQLEPAESSYATSRVAVLPVPFERPTTYGKGTAEGPAAIVPASPAIALPHYQLRTDPF